MTDTLVLSEQHGSVLTLTLNDPERRNPISGPDMINALVAAIEAADRADNVSVVILTGAGASFSSGGDMNKMQPGAGLRDPLPARTVTNYRRGIQRLPVLFQSIDVPIIAAVNGPAIGAGCDLACMCDIRIAAESARFAESFVKIGLVPGDGGAWLLPRVVGFAKAAELALTGATITASEALACGLVSRVVPDAELMATANQIADQIAANPPIAVRMTKRLLREAQGASLTNVLEMSSAMQALAHATADHDEAVQSFLEKRRPTFAGN
jgi:enoyl-CoA hydratase/carnithine racemase